MEIQYFKDPVPHFIIDNFLVDRASRAILQEAIDLEPFYNQAKVNGHSMEATHIDTCEVCARNNDKFKNTIRDNQTVSLDKLFEGKRDQSKTLTYLHEALSNVQLQYAMDNAEKTFPFFNIVNSSETLISRYGKCDFYGWHTDPIPEAAEARLVTVSYYVNKEPLNFEGGRLMFLNHKTGEIKYIEPKHNRAVIFMSFQAYHGVEYVNLDGKSWDEGRFSIQFWLGFNNRFRFRK